MLREDAIELVRQLVDAVNAHDHARLTSFYADNAVLLSPVFPMIVGRDAIKDNWQSIFSRFPDWQASVTGVLVDGDRIAFMGTATATDRNGWFGEPPTGERIEYGALVLLTIAHGKIVRDERIYDLTNVLQRLEKSRIDKELRLAAEVQRALSSSSAYAQGGQLFCEVAGRSLPSRTIGGDFFEFTPLASGNFAMVLGDVAGKGPASAILAALIQGILATEQSLEARPASVLSHVNALLVRREVDQRFATLVYGVLAPDGAFTYALGGHIPPVLIARSGTRRLTAGGPILGAFSNSAFHEETVQLTAGDTVVMFTDGISEARNTRDEEYGEVRLVSRLAGLAGRSAGEILAEVLKDVQEFSNGAVQLDDITLSTVRYSVEPTNKRTTPHRSLG